MISLLPPVVPVGITALQFLLAGEALNHRTLVLLVVLGIAATISWFTVRWLGKHAAKWLPNWLVISLVVIALFGLLPVLTMLTFAIENRIIEGHVEADTFSEFRVRRILWSLFGAMGMFVPTGLRYTLPFPALGFALAGGWTFFQWLRGRSSTNQHSYFRSLS